jgi:aryl-alcohol dehydrogenase-like predicted oxidoreductase
MEQRALGRTGIPVSVLGFGCGSIGGLMVRGDRSAQSAAVARALDAGISYFDTAALYGDGQSEQSLGQVLTELGAWDRVAVGTKVRLNVTERSDMPGALRRSLVGSLRRLGRDSVDLLQLHNQVLADGSELSRGVNQSDVLGDIADGMRRVVAEGLARHAGFTATGDAGASRAIVQAGTYETMQAYFNVLNPSAAAPGISGGAQDFDGIITEAGKHGVGVLAIRVLAAGAVSGSRDRPANAGDPGTALVRGGEFERDVERAKSLRVLVAEWGLECPEELAFRFALWPQAVSSALVGFSNIDQLEQAIRWAELGPLAEDLVQRVLEVPR